MKSILKNKWFLTDQTLVSGYNFTFALFVSKTLGLKDFGTLSLLWMLVYFIGNLSQNFLSVPAYSKFAQKTSSSTLYLQTLSMLALALSLTLALIFLALSYLLKHLGVELIIFSLPSYTAFFLMAYLLYDFSKRLCFIKDSSAKTTLIYDGLSIVIQIALLGYFFTRLTLERILLIQSIAMCFVALLYLPKWYLSLKNTRFIKRTICEHFSFSSHLIMGGILQFFSSHFFLFIGAEFLALSVIGMVRIVQSFWGVISVFLQLLEHKIPLSASKLLQVSGHKVMFSYLRKSALTSFIFFGGMGSLLLLSYKPIFQTLYPKEPQPTFILMFLFMGLYALVISGTFMRFWMRTLERNRPFFYGQLLAGTCSIVLAYPLLKLFGVYGLVIGMALSQVIFQWYCIKSISSSIV